MKFTHTQKDRQNNKRQNDRIIRNLIERQSERQSERQMVTKTKGHKGKKTNSYTQR